jgi:hypothetical protein
MNELEEARNDDDDDDDDNNNNNNNNNQQNETTQNKGIRFRIIIEQPTAAVGDAVLARPGRSGG